MHRVPHTFNLPVLLRRSRHGTSLDSGPSRVGTSVYSGPDRLSDDDDVLYMATTRKQKGTESSGYSGAPLSTRQLNVTAFEIESTMENKAWSMIEREIREWQYICQTGHAAWRLTASKYSRKRLNQSLDGPASRVGAIGSPHALDSMARRASSDSFLRDSHLEEDSAHRIAIQLLGACYTLPPSSTSDTLRPEYMASSNAHLLGHNATQSLISSLRMHTSFRYSPCYGHEPRNSSPVQSWTASLHRADESLTPPSGADCPSPGEVALSGALGFLRDGSSTRPQRHVKSTSRAGYGEDEEHGSGHTMEQSFASIPHLVEEPSSNNAGSRAYCGTQSPVVRRRRARERGEIFSSADSTHHYNTPASGSMTPNHNLSDCDAHDDTKCTRSAIQSPTGLEETTMSAPNESPLELSLLISPNLIVPLPPRPPQVLLDPLPESSTSAAVAAADLADVDLPASLQPNKPFSPAKQTYKVVSRRRHRKSTLSEVYTVEMTPESMRNPNEIEIEHGGEFQTGASSSAFVSPVPAVTPIGPLTTEPHSRGLLGVTEFGSSIEMAIKRLSLTRMSSTGTQIFRADADGMELDGLPVGPAKGTWDAAGKAGKHAYL